MSRRKLCHCIFCLICVFSTKSIGMVERLVCIHAAASNVCDQYCLVIMCSKILNSGALLQNGYVLLMYNSWGYAVLSFALVSSVA